MTIETFADWFEPLGLAVLFAAIFAFAGRVRLAALERHEREAMSFFAGISLAYVFMRLLPEIETAKTALKLPGHLPLPPEPYLVALAALCGCILFFALGRLDESGGARRHDPARLALFALYVALVSYSRIALIEHGEAPVLLFAVAMAAHFIALDHALGRDLGPLYRRHGHLILAVASLVGWAVGASEAVGPPAMLLLFGFVAGAIIAITLIEELPDAREARLGSFIAGSVLYALILLPLE